LSSSGASLSPPPHQTITKKGIPKVGVTEWLKFFRFTYGAGDYLSIPHWKVEREEFIVRSLPLEIAQDLWNDPTWTRAVFLRDPAERLLSAYLDKVVKNAYTQRIFKIGALTDPKETRPILSFGEFVDLLVGNNTRCVIPTGLHTCSDPHWKPQYLTCGLDVTLPLVDFVGNFNHLAEHTKMLLERVDMWESYGKIFDDGSSTSNNSTQIMATSSSGCFVPPPALPTNSSPLPWGFNQRGPSQEETHQHSTGS
jgi:hypothetical protein